MFDWINKTIAVSKDWLGFFGLIIAGFLYLGFTVDPPWAKDIAELKQQVGQILERSEKSTELSLKTQKIVLQAQLVDAKKELKENPNSRSAQLLVNQIEDQIAEIDAILRSQGD